MSNRKKRRERLRRQIDIALSKTTLNFPKPEEEFPVITSEITISHKSQSSQLNESSAIEKTQQTGLENIEIDEDVEPTITKTPELEGPNIPALEGPAEYDDVEEVDFSLDEIDMPVLGKDIEIDEPTEIKTELGPKCTFESDHAWTQHHENQGEVVYYCVNCHTQKTERKNLNVFNSTIEPIHQEIPIEPEVKLPEPPKDEPVEMETQQEEPITTHIDAPQDSLSWKGNPMQKILMFNRLATNGRIFSHATSLAEKTEVVNRIIPKLIIDSSVASQQLFEKIQEAGYDGVYLGNEKTIRDTFNMAVEQKAILITDVKEFHLNDLPDARFQPILINAGSDMLSQNILEIKKQMTKFEGK